MSQLMQTAMASYELLVGYTVVTILFVQWPLWRTVGSDSQSLIVSCACYRNSTIQGGAMMVLESWPTTESKEKINANLC